MGLNNIPVTKSFLPSLDDYHIQLERIFKNQWLTNRGELVKELETNLKEYLKVKNIICTNNGTIPIQIALKLLGNQGEIITTPFSYVATCASIVWESCTPVFVDINEKYLSIDENLIEAAITNKTTCILATHVFGNPCNVEKINKIAVKHNLKVIYDAAHCFGVNYNNSSIFNYGDISTCSFHATKLFHTAEGGAIFCQDEELFMKIFRAHNFGHTSPETFSGVGINAKMSEIHAALGLVILPHMSSIIDSRKNIVQLYNEKLDFSHLSKLHIREKTDWNYSYYPVIFESEEKLKLIVQKLNNENIYPRRYFYPSLNNLPYVKNSIMTN